MARRNARASRSGRPGGSCRAGRRRWMRSARRPGSSATHAGPADLRRLAAPRQGPGVRDRALRPRSRGRAGTQGALRPVPGFHPRRRPQVRRAGHRRGAARQRGRVLRGRPGARRRDHVRRRHQGGLPARRHRGRRAPRHRDRRGHHSRHQRLRYPAGARGGRILRVLPAGLPVPSPVRRQMAQAPGEGRHPGGDRARAARLLCFGPPAVGTARGRPPAPVADAGRVARTGRPTGGLAGGHVPRVHGWRQSRPGVPGAGRGRHVGRDRPRPRRASRDRPRPERIQRLRGRTPPGHRGVRAASPRPCRRTGSAGRGRRRGRHGGGRPPAAWAPGGAHPRVPGRRPRHRAHGDARCRVRAVPLARRGRRSPRRGHRPDLERRRLVERHRGRRSDRPGGGRGAHQGKEAHPLRPGRHERLGGVQHRGLGNARGVGSRADRAGAGRGPRRLRDEPQRPGRPRARRRPVVPDRGLPVHADVRRGLHTRLPWPRAAAVAGGLRRRHPPVRGPSPGGGAGLPGPGGRAGAQVRRHPVRRPPP